MTDTSKSCASAAIMLAGLFILRFIPLMYPDGRFWGFNHLLFLPLGWTIAYTVLTIGALALLYLPSGTRAGIFLTTRFNDIMYEHPRRYIYRGVTVIAAGILFAVFSAPTHFLGDGYALLANLASSAGTYYLWTETVIITVIQIIQSIIGAPSEPNALLAFRIVAVIAGMVTMVFFYLITGTVSDSPTIRLLVFFSSIGSGVVLLFFGYVENYPLLWAVYAGFVYFGIRSVRNGKSFLPVLVFLLLSIAVHLQAAMFIPAFIYVLFSGDKGRAAYQRLKYLWWFLAAIAIIAGAIALFRLYASNLYFENIFLPLFAGKPASPEYSLISVPHIADMLNELVLLSPLLPLLVILAGFRVFRSAKSRLIVFLGLNAVAGIVFLLAIDPQLAMPRDWDLFSLCAYGLTLALILTLDNKRPRLPERLILPMVFFLISAPLPYLAVNLNTENSVEYAKHIVDTDRMRSRGTMLLVKKFHVDRGDTFQADSLNTLYGQYYPHVWQYSDVFSHIKQGRRDLALQQANRIMPDRFSKDYHNMWACVYFIHNDLEKALVSAKKSVQVQSYFDDSWLYLGMIYGRLQRYDSALDALGTGFRLNRQNPRILQELAGIYLVKEQTDSSIYFAKLLLDLQPNYAPALLTLARAYVKIGDLGEAERYAAQYEQFGTNEPFYEQRLVELRQSMKTLESNR
ncbi:MAG: hypothetical protein JW763_07960 [candidate division Zixibacteria bacterium]|nr:hypothetical protein [candidate division Zixibacteria bacterium]